MSGKPDASAEKSSNKTTTVTTSTSSKNIRGNGNDNNGNSSNKKRRRKRRRRPLTLSERTAAVKHQKRKKAYERMRAASLETSNAPPSIWSFDSLFPATVLDEESVREDLYGSREREEVMRERQRRLELERNEREHSLAASGEGFFEDDGRDGARDGRSETATREENVGVTREMTIENIEKDESYVANADRNETLLPSQQQQQQQQLKQNKPIDRTLTRMVEDRIYGLTRSIPGSLQYSSSLLDSSRAVQFREGVRLGKALDINIDRLCYFAKKDMRRNRLEEARAYYLEAQSMEPTDGRPYLGLSRIAERRGDLEHARGILREGIARCSGGYVAVRGPDTVRRGTRVGNGGGGNSDSKIESAVSFREEEGPVLGSIPDLGPNPFLLQALGTLEQKSGNLSEAEELYLRAIRSRPSHAAAWVSLAQLRTRELRQGAGEVRACYRSAERELARIGARPSAYIYTAWASMEYKKGGGDGSTDDVKNLKTARELYNKALEADPNCSVAYLQLGAMESDVGNYEEARRCFEAVLKFDQRNSRVLQAYAIMESRQKDADSRKVLDLFERALKANPRDAAVYQAYALYVVELGDVDSARDLLRKGTEVNKRHAPVWQAWGVLETRHGSPKVARDVFQQGIWSCAQPGGGQSGGRRCARLWQAWGVLESREGDQAAARRCFGRALDADRRNVAAVTAWTLMEAELGNLADARSIFERTLRLFRGPSADKTAVWRAYEVMEERWGNTREAQEVFGRSMRESMAAAVADSRLESNDVTGASFDLLDSAAAVPKSKPLKRDSREVEVSRWNTGSNELDADVWINNGSIEGKLPASMMKKLKNRR